MDVFEFRQRLVSYYARYTRSFIKIADPNIRAKVDGALDDGALWPEPLLQLNPTFLPGGTIDDLVADGTLHSECKKIFRIDKSDSDHSGKQLLLHKHQADAIRKSKEGKEAQRSQCFVRIQNRFIDRRRYDRPCCMRALVPKNSSSRDSRYRRNCDSCEVTRLTSD